MDGWGLGKVASADAIQHANAPFTKSLYSKYPNTTLITCGEAVGLPDGQMGNSEVGHLNLGAGRVVYQELQRINVAIREGAFAKNPVLLESIRFARDNNKTLHLMGLVSDGGVHSHINHLKAITSICQAEGLSDVLVHAFTDGRDTDPKSGLGFLTDLQSHLAQSVGQLATITGRYYAMDRDKRWERVKLAYDALVNGQGKPAADMLEAVKASYEEGVTDEFIKPVINAKLGNAVIKEGDVVICFNFRTDRCREITQVLTQIDMPDLGMKTLRLHYTTMTQYDHTYKNVQVVFENDDVLVFKDIHPKAPIHYLFVPKEHFSTFAEVPKSKMDVMTKIGLAIQEVSEKEKLVSRGYKTLINTGKGGGQEVFHLHVHFLCQ